MKDDEIKAYVEKQSLLMEIDIPDVKFRKMKTCYGTAYLYQWKIVLNRVWVHKASDCLVKDVILHELVHLKNYWIYASNAHDRTFHEMCDKYGCHGNSCFDAKSRRAIIAATKGRQLRRIATL